MHPFDKTDPLRHKRDEFVLPDGLIYLDGNSLGPLPVAARERANDVVSRQWGEGLISSWNNHNWIGLPSVVGDKIGRLIGAAPGQVVCCDSISVNLFKVLSAALKMRPDRKVIATTRDNFPTDIYMVEGIIAQLGADYEIRFIDEQNIDDGLDDDVAVVMLTQVNFRTGYRQDMPAVTRRVQSCGALMLWDLAHSAGAFDVALDACNVDFAVGCTYKYLNGGPGAPAFIYVASRLQQDYCQPLSGWMGHRSPFDFSPDYQGADGVAQNLAGTPGVVGMSILDAALSVFDNVSVATIRAKAEKLMALFVETMTDCGVDNDFVMISPPSAQRGNQIALSHPHSYAICQAWIEAGVVADFRAPDVLRVGFSPLFLRFGDIVSAVDKLAEIMRSQRYLEPRFNKKHKVT